MYHKKAHEPVEDEDWVFMGSRTYGTYEDEFDVDFYIKHQLGGFLIRVRDAEKVYEYSVENGGESVEPNEPESELTKEREKIIRDGIDRWVGQKITQRIENKRMNRPNKGRTSLLLKEMVKGEWSNPYGTDRFTNYESLDSDNDFSAAGYCIEPVKNCEERRFVAEFETVVELTPTEDMSAVTFKGQGESRTEALRDLIETHGEKIKDIMESIHPKEME